MPRDRTTVEIPTEVVPKLQKLADDLGMDLGGALTYVVKANAGHLAREVVAHATDTVEWTLADGTPIEPYLEFMNSMDGDLKGLLGK